jgi:hypothetical protein
MFKKIKKTFKKGEITLFKALRFDSPSYDYKFLEGNDEAQLHLKLVESYFQEQPGAIRVLLTKSYLFIKKTLKFTLRKIKRLVRS